MGGGPKRGYRVSRGMRVGIGAYGVLVRTGKGFEGGTMGGRLVRLEEGAEDWELDSSEEEALDEEEEDEDDGDDDDMELDLSLDSGGGRTGALTTRRAGCSRTSVSNFRFFPAFTSTSTPSVLRFLPKSFLTALPPSLELPAASLTLSRSISSKPYTRCEKYRPDHIALLDDAYVTPSQELEPFDLQYEVFGRRDMLRDEREGTGDVSLELRDGLDGFGDGQEDLGWVEGREEGEADPHREKRKAEVCLLLRRSSVGKLRKWFACKRKSWGEVGLAS